jgi:hypothetical protein
MDMATASVLHVRLCCMQGIDRTAGTRCVVHCATRSTSRRSTCMTRQHSQL